MPLINPHEPGVPGRFDPSGHSAGVSAGQGDTAAIDETVAVVLAGLAELGERLLNAPSGVLGVSSTGLHGDVSAGLEALMQIRVQAEALVTIAASKADADSETWRGMRSLFRSTGKASEGEVNAAVRAGAFCSTYPSLAAAWVAGDVSGTQVRQIGHSLLKLPVEHREQAVEVLVDHAPTLTARELAQASRAILNAVSPGWDERVAEIEAKTAYFSVFPELDGYGVRGHLTVEQAGWLRTVLDAHTNVVVADDLRSRSERQAEALVTIFRTYATSDTIPNLAMARPTFLVLTTAADLAAMAADAAPGDLPRTVYGDQLDLTTAKRMLSEANIVPVLADAGLDAATAERIRRAAVLLTKRRRSKDHAERRGAAPMFLRLLTTPLQPLALGREVRIVPGWLRNAVTLRDHHCVVDGCDVPAHRCEIHHVRPWALGGGTDIDNLATLCLRHHRTVENGTWQLRVRTAADGPGRFWLAEAAR